MVVEKTVTETREYATAVTYTFTKPIVEAVTTTVEKTVTLTIAAQSLETNPSMILSMAAIAIAVAFSAITLKALKKKTG